jgi:serine/threonine protein kinase
MNFHWINLRPLSSGAYGDLFIGQRSDNGSRIVVKYLREFRGAYSRKAFDRAVRLQARGLPGVVPLLGADTGAERPYCVMPYLERGTLTHFAGRLAPSHLEAAAIELARTLATLHAAAEVHGDLKPDNILVTQDGHLLVTDPLGAGSVLTKLLSVNRGGTPGYWAPEVRRGASISYAADVFSYGATMHHLATGQRPEDGRPLDLNAAGYKAAPKIQEIVAACCEADSRIRPNMQEVFQILNGQSWADIQTERKQRQEALGRVCLVAGLGALMFGLARGRASR